ncbi:hypothetical protein VKT23_014675 [Stygiomarasmius scandens]|uniref:Uncharacterized protein n=1 Tax=Marasmiellus scandens TaxID=2682957 RepID=A0ABR1J083_9AGAR
MAYSSTLPAAYSAQNDSHVPPPPAPKAPLNRPKLPSAYVLPFPTTTPSWSVYSPLSPPPSNALYATQAHHPPPRPFHASYSSPTHPPPRPLQMLPTLLNCFGRLLGLFPAPHTQAVQGQDDKHISRFLDLLESPQISLLFLPATELHLRQRRTAIRKSDYMVNFTERTKSSCVENWSWKKDTDMSGFFCWKSQDSRSFPASFPVIGSPHIKWVDWQTLPASARRCVLVMPVQTSLF